MRHIKTIPVDIDEVVPYVPALNQNLQSSVCFKGFHGDITVFYGGICRMTERIGEVWIHILDKSFIETPRVITELINSHFSLGYERIQSTALSTDKISHRWMLYHGFTHEGTLRSFGAAGEDLNIYSKLKEDLWA